MTILMRTDLGGSHGMGHARRCLALAQALRSRGARVCFVTQTPALAAFVAPLACEVEARPVACPMPGTLVIDTKADDWANDPTALLMLRADGWQVVRLDHPQAAPETCDLLIGPVNHWEAATVETQRARFGDRFLYGWDYVMLAPAVTKHQPLTYGQRASAITLSAGGSDPEHLLDWLYTSTHDLQGGVRRVFLVGDYAEGLLADKLDWAEQRGQSCYQEGRACTITRFHQEHVRRAALLVTRFGVTVYEALWCRTPMLVYGQSQEAIDGAAHLVHATQGALASGWWLQKTAPTALCQYLRQAWDMPAIRQQQHAASAGLMDGQGVTRVAEAILGLSA